MVYTVEGNARKTKRFQGKKRLTNDYFHEIKPMLVVLRILGRLPCNLTTKGLDDFKWDEPVVLYSIITYILQSCLSVYFIVTSFKSTDDTGESSLWLSMAVTATHNLFIPFTFWTETSNVKRYINLWHNFKDEYYFAMNRQWGPHYKRLVRMVSYSCFPILFLMSAANVFYVCKAPFYTLLFAIVAGGGGLAAFCIWLVTCWEIRILSEEIASKMAQINVCGTEAGELRRLWLKLVVLSTELGNTLAGNNLFFCISTFVFLTTGVFGIIAKIYQSSGPNSSGMVIISVVDIFSVCASFIFIDQVYRTANSVGNKFTEKLMKINFSIRDPTYIKENQLILRLNELMKPTIKVKGFYKNDRQHIAMTMKSAITYLILLLQSVKLSKKVIKISSVNVTNT